MTGSQFSLVLLLLCALPLTAVAGLSAELTPLSTDAAQPLLRPVRVTIHNDSDRDVESLQVQWQHGGPTMVVSATISPGQTVDLTASLPAVATIQTFDLVADFSEFLQ